MKHSRAVSLFILIFTSLFNTFKLNHFKSVILLFFVLLVSGNVLNASDTIRVIVLTRISDGKQKIIAPGKNVQYRLHSERKKGFGYFADVSDTGLIISGTGINPDNLEMIGKYLISGKLKGTSLFGLFTGLGVVLTAGGIVALIADQGIAFVVAPLAIGLGITFISYSVQGGIAWLVVTAMYQHYDLTHTWTLKTCRAVQFLDTYRCLE